MPNQALIIVLRLLHIMGGFFWAGSALVLARFILPAIRASGPAGGAVMQQLMQHRKLPVAINIAAAIAILSGLGLVWEMQSISNGMWAHSAMGRTFSIGGVLGLTAAIIGGAIARPTANKIGALGAQIAATQGPPSAEQAAQMQALQNRMAKTVGIVAGLLSLTVAFMAVARYV